MLKSFTNDFTNATTWDTILHMLMAVYRATEHSYMPNLLFTGNETNMPVDVMAGLPPQQHSFYNTSNFA